MENRRHTYSEKLYAAACESIPGGVNSALRNAPPHRVFKKAQGSTLVDVDGNEYRDYHCAFGAALVGHAHPAIRRRVMEATNDCLLAGAGTTELEIELAQRIRRHVPSAEKVLLCNSGSEAVAHALRVARAFTGRNKILKFQGCYHGFYDSVLCNLTSAAERLGGLDPASAGIPPEGYANTLVANYNRLEEVEDALKSHSGEVAAVIVEPVAHNVGCLLPRPGFLEGLRELTRAHGALLIFDEVITGFRHRLGGYQTIAQVTPDLTTFAKALANGYPIGALCGKAEVMDRFKTRPGGDTYFAGTYNGNAASCAAALATLEILERQPVHAHLFRLGERLRAGLREIHTRLGVRATVAGFGSIFVTYFMDRPAETYPELLANDAARFVAYRQALIARGVFKMPLPLKRAHLSYAHSEEDIARTLQVAEDVLKDAAFRAA
jgi:glutamate-1-semialdehyde 2,1-aminomutase